MRIRHALQTGMVWLPLLAAAGLLSVSAGGQSLLPAGSLGEGAAPVSQGSAAQAPANPGSNDPASKLCADGTRAIDQGRWADAVTIFTQVADAHGDRADRALYWKAYAENKLGQTEATLKSCTALREGFPKSRWIDDCGALEVEIHARSGKPVSIDPTQSDDVKLLALNTMLHQNEPLALAEIQEILNGDSSDKLKKEVQFILGTHYSNSTYAQIVRISYVEGDVRIQRGAPTGKPSSAVWEKATANVPLETGFSVATGQGRAEIEFENASTIYLGENSVLTLNDLHETAGIPFSELGLIAGTVSLNFKPYVAGEKLILHTQTSDLLSHFPDRTYARVQAFTDAVAITPLEGGDLRLPWVAKEDVKPGDTWVYQPGRLQATKEAQPGQEFAAWDRWVQDRVAARAALMAPVLEASGLAAPIPGMAEMAGQGKFFDCAPYGTCWEPNAEAAQEEKSAAARPMTKPGQPHLQLAAYHPQGQAGPAQHADAADPAAWFDAGFVFPCTPYAIRWRMVRDAASGQLRPVATDPLLERPYSWAVCHAGSWIRHKKHYVWVAGGKRRHIDPVRWVKFDRKVGFVPLHPYDVKDRPALNARHVVFVVANKNPLMLEPERFDEGRSLEYLKAPPKEYARVPLRPLAVAEAPRMEAHPFVRAAAGPEMKARAAIPIRFDAKTQTFLAARQQAAGGSTKMVFAPISNRSGSLQSHSASFAGASSSSFRGNGSSFSGGGSRSGGSGSGGSGSAGGGSHGGGGGASSAASASHGGGGSSGGGSVSSAGSASSASAASSASHH